jgi:hypothetical protein
MQKADLGHKRKKINRICPGTPGNLIYPIRSTAIIIIKEEIVVYVVC